MRVVRGLLGLLLVTLSACAAPVTEAILAADMTTRQELVDVAQLLPEIGAEAGHALAREGFALHDPAACKPQFIGAECSLKSSVPDIQPLAENFERAHFVKVKHKEHSGGQVLGVMVDIDKGGAVLQAVGFRSGYWAY
jgi:hypothetical protein